MIVQYVEEPEERCGIGRTEVSNVRLAQCEADNDQIFEVVIGDLRHLYRDDEAGPDAGREGSV